MKNCCRRRHWEDEKTFLFAILSTNIAVKRFAMSFQSYFSCSCSNSISLVCVRCAANIINTKSINIHCQIVKVNLHWGIHIDEVLRINVQRSREHNSIRQHAKPHISCLFRSYIFLILIYHSALPPQHPQWRQFKLGKMFLALLLCAGSL